MPVPGFSGLSKSTTKAAAPAAKPASLLDKAKTDIKATAAAPVKSRAQQLREDAEAAEREEAAAAIATEPEVLEPEPVKAAPARANPKSEAASRAVSVPKSSGFGLTIDRKSMTNALLAMVEVTETKKVPSLYPTLVCSGGEQGGLWVSPDWQQEDVGALLPQGKKPIKGFYLGYRMVVTIWPKEYDKAAGNVKPCNSGVIPCDNVELAKLATQAVKNYQFTKKLLKSKFDLDAQGNGAGRPSVAVEVAVFMPGEGERAPGIVILRTVSGYGPASRTTANLARMVDPETQEIANAPMTIKIDTFNEESASQAWPCHYFDFATDLTSTGKAVYDAFEAFKAEVMEDAEFMAKFGDWMNGADAPMTDATAARLKLAASL